MDAGSLIGEHREVAIAELVATATHSVRSLAESRGVSLQLGESVAITGRRIHGDTVLLHRLVLNLLDNALKHAPSGSTIHVRVDATDQNVLIDVDDEGPGVPPELRDRLFERFVHGVQSTTPNDNRAHGTGAGLGLAIVKRILEAHNSDIKLISGENKGSCFRFRLKKG
jgi:signal transduction histidine kinase